MNGCFIFCTITMDSKALKILAAVFVATTVGFAGLFAFEYSAYSSTQGSYSNLQGSYSNLVTTYDNVQGSVVLKNAFSHWDDIAIENLSLVMPQYVSNATLHWIGGFWFSSPLKCALSPLHSPPLIFREWEMYFSRTR